MLKDVEGKTEFQISVFHSLLYYYSNIINIKPNFNVEIYNNIEASSLSLRNKIMKEKALLKTKDVD